MKHQSVSCKASEGLRRGLTFSMDDTTRLFPECFAPKEIQSFQGLYFYRAGRWEHLPSNIIF